MDKNDGAPPAEVGAGAKIVLVHQDPESQEVLELLRALEQRDYHCAVFSCCELALEQCEPSLLGAAIVSLDLPAPGATDFARRLRELAGDAFLPIVVVGGEERIRDEIQCFAGACDDFMATPISTPEFLVRIATLIERQRVHADLVNVNAELGREQERRRALAALIVHDLRNPLSAIVGNVQLLEEVLSDAEDTMIGQCLDDLEQLSTRTLSMVAGLLDVEEFEGGTLQATRESVDVYGLVARMPSFYKTATEARYLHMHVRCPETVHASFDRQLIARILENLLDNAVRYAPRCGKVVLSVLAEGRDLIFEVGNDGPAIPTVERGRMFERYYRLEGRRKGTRSNRGLGLYFCRLAADAHSGTITVAERRELPACFVLRLPDCIVDETSQSDSTEVAAPPPG
ncbi:MAG: hypothetical protein GY811_04980 [Myxococcales bacterium]|nr:hypothetical protein [Myxococcales bacterium]